MRLYTYTCSKCSYQNLREDQGLVKMLCDKCGADLNDIKPIQVKLNFKKNSRIKFNDILNKCDTNNSIISYGNISTKLKVNRNLTPSQAANTPYESQLLNDNKIIHNRKRFKAIKFKNRIHSRNSNSNKNMSINVEKPEDINRTHNIGSTSLPRIKRNTQATPYSNQTPKYSLFNNSFEESKTKIQSKFYINNKSHPRVSKYINEFVKKKLKEEKLNKPFERIGNYSPDTKKINKKPRNITPILTSNYDKVRPKVNSHLVGSSSTTFQQSRTPNSHFFYNKKEKSLKNHEFNLSKINYQNSIKLKEVDLETELLEVSKQISENFNNKDQDQSFIMKFIKIKALYGFQGLR